MKAVECAEVGRLDGLRIVERADPVSGPNMVTVSVQAAGVNYVDALFVQGRYQLKPPVPFVPGSEVAGVITAVGSGVDPARIGERIVAMCGLGGFADQVVVPAAAAVPIPDGLDSMRAAAFIQSFCTARFALESRATITDGESVLVLGAGGGVGQAAIAVARAAGARVVGVASTAPKRAAAYAAGAHIVLDASGRRASVDGSVDDASAPDGSMVAGDDPDRRYGADQPSDPASEPWGRAFIDAVREWSNGGVDVALDPIGGTASLAALRSLGTFGRLLVIGFPAGIQAIPANQVLLRNRSVIGVDWGAWSLHDAAAQRRLLDGLLRDVEAGRIEPPIPEVRPLDGVVEALEDLLARRVTGKLVLVP